MRAGRLRSQSRNRVAPPNGQSDAATRLDPLARISCPVLYPAARRVLANWRAADASETWAEVAEELGRLAEAVQSAAGGTPANPAEVGPGTPSGRELLTLLQGEVLRELEGGVQPEDYSLPELMAAFERVHSALTPREDSEPEAFLSGPEGLELVAEIAHDLRSPLTSILTLAEMLRRGQSGEINQLQQRQLGLIYSAALALASTASDILELAHGGERIARQRPSPFSIVELLESVRDIVSPMAEEKGVSVRLLPNSTDRRLGFSPALSRVLLNLTTNALKFTDEGFVEIAARSTGATQVEFSVRDTGRGINPAALSTLYQPFRRAPGRRGYCFSGTGLGLVICRRLVEAMDSKLEFETRPDWGTRFYFELELPPAPQLD